MKQHTRILLATSFILLASLACNAVLPQAEPTAPVLQQFPGIQVLQTEDEVPRISIAEAKAALDSGQATIVDVRDTASYIESHAAGSVSIPLDRFEININTIPLEESEWIITYCTWQNEHTSARAAFLLINRGYTNVHAMLGGLQAWYEAGYPIE